MSHENTKLDQAKAPVEQAVDTERIGKLKLWLLYVLIGGLVAAALIAIVAVLVGEFNTVLQKALGTIFIFVTHSLFILGLVWTDTQNRLGRSIIPTTLLATGLANIVTSTLGTWEIISTETAWRAVLFYMLLIGSAFLTTAAFRLRVPVKTIQILTYVTVGSIVAWTLMLTPWVFAVVENFNPLYFRIIAALTILVATTLLVTVILRTIALAREVGLREKIKAERAAKKMHGGLLAYYIVIGIIVSQVWFVGMIGFIADSTEQSWNNSDSLYQ